MISGVTPGILAIASTFSAARSPMKTPRDVSGRPSGRTAFAMSLPSLLLMLELRIAPSDFVLVILRRGKLAARLTDC
jgi:hypothetical protein